MSTRPAALLTDFGYADAYAGIMKGVLLARCPEACFFDLTHGIPPGEILTGALHLLAALPYVPHDTLFLAVVDPGVGGSRRPVALRAGGHLFVGPDNGLLWPAASSLGPVEAFHLDRPRYWMPDVSATFHGRDIFAPVTAMLLLGRALEDLGSPIADPVTLALPGCRHARSGVAGEVLMVDHFGNAVTSVRPQDLGSPPPGSAAFRFGERVLRGPATHYGAVHFGEPLVIVGSLGYYEAAVNGGSAAEMLGLERGSRVTATPDGAEPEPS